MSDDVEDLEDDDYDYTMEINREEVTVISED